MRSGRRWGGWRSPGLGVWLPLWAYAISNIAVLGALFWWQPPRRITSTLPAERLTTAIRSGIRHARNNRHLHSTLVRTLAFFPFASAYWALLPLIARAQSSGGAEFYGLLLGAVGLGAIVGSAALSWVKAQLGADKLGGARQRRDRGGAGPVRTIQ